MALSDTDRVYDALLVMLVRAGDAREAVQEAWGGICRGWVRLSDPEMLPAGTYGILSRKCADRIRGLSARRARFASAQAAPEPSEAAQAPLRHEILAALGQLSAEHRIAAMFYFSEGLTLAETAAATGVPVGTAKSRLFHARQQLKDLPEGDLT